MPPTPPLIAETNQENKTKKVKPNTENHPQIIQEVSNKCTQQFFTLGRTEDYKKQLQTTSMEYLTGKL